jgi:phage tail tape-measure protein
MNIITKIALIGTLALLAACGSSEPGRVQGGAVAGAATGATVGLVGGPVGVVVGGVIGGGAGAIAGASTTPKQVDLGKPVWKNNQATYQ